MTEGNSPKEPAHTSRPEGRLRSVSAFRRGFTRCEIRWLSGDDRWGPWADEPEVVATAGAGAALTRSIDASCLEQVRERLHTPRAQFSATQYALLTALAGFSRRFLAAGGGVFADAHGWVPYFAFTAVCAVPGLLLLYLLQKRGTTGLVDRQSTPAQ